jgi:hypothetical protein
MGSPGHEFKCRMDVWVVVCGGGNALPVVCERLRYDALWLRNRTVVWEALGASLGVTWTFGVWFVRGAKPPRGQSPPSGT